MCHYTTNLAFVTPACSRPIHQQTPVVTLLSIDDANDKHAIICALAGANPNICMDCAKGDESPFSFINASYSGIIMYQVSVRDAHASRLPGIIDACRPPPPAPAADTLSADPVVLISSIARLTLSLCFSPHSRPFVHPPLDSTQVKSSNPVDLLKFIMNGTCEGAVIKANQWDQVKDLQAANSMCDIVPMPAMPNHIIREFDGAFASLTDYGGAEGDVCSSAVVQIFSTILTSMWEDGIMDDIVAESMRESADTDCKAVQTKQADLSLHVAGTCRRYLPVQEYGTACKRHHPVVCHGLSIFLWELTHPPSLSSLPSIPHLRLTPILLTHQTSLA